MTQRTETPARRRRSWLMVGLLPLLLGVVTLLVAGYLLLLKDGGWPWHASMSTRSDGGAVSATAEITDDGTVHRFTGTQAEALVWLDRKQDELKELHGIDTKIAVGQVLRPAGLLLVALGSGMLLWRLIDARSRQRGIRRAGPQRA